LKKIASMAAIIMVLSTSFALAQSNPNMEKMTGTAASQWAWRHSVTGNPNNPSASDYYRRHYYRRR
jgi:hypothetical protein